MAKRQILINYQRHSSMADTACFYCGAHGESKDHVPAVCHAYNYPEYERIIVRCCIFCNGLLGARFLPTLFDRCNFLLFKFHFKFRKVLSMPHWEEEEIEDLNGRLKRSVILGMKRKKDAIKRIKKLQELLQTLQPYWVDDGLSNSQS